MNDPLLANEVENGTTDDPPQDEQSEGVGWMPAVLAFGLLLSAALFICCGVTTYMLFQKRAEFAATTLEAMIPTVEQSQLAPEDKQEIIVMLQQVKQDAEAGRLENWQAAGVMTRLARLPMLEWGQLAAVESMIQADEQFDAQAKAEASKQLSRLRHAIANDTATVFDLGSVVAPVMTETQSPGNRRMIASPSPEQLQEVITRARLIADRDEVPDRVMPEQSIVELVRQEIEAGKTIGTR